MLTCSERMALSTIRVPAGGGARAVSESIAATVNVTCRMRR
jgi:hypothetical protein